MKQKRLLLLGGSAQQCVAIDKAREMGLYTVLCDYLPDNPGQHLAHRFYQESTTDVEAVCRIAQEEQVDGILAYASDPAALPAAIACERLGLPTNPSQSVATLGVKHLFRQFLADHGFPCPRHLSFPADTTPDLSSLRFPLVVKPTDSSGSKGVSMLTSPDQLPPALEHARAYSRNRILIAEEFIEQGYPHIIGGDIFVVDGQIRLYGLMSCLRTSQGRGLIPIGEMHPSGLNSRQTEAIHTELQHLIASLGIRMGELNVEVIIDRDDRPHFLELGPRAGGNMIPIQLSDIYGLDLVRANIQAALGQRPDLSPRTPEGCHMHYVLHSHRPGHFRGITVDPWLKPSLYRQCLYKREGDPVEPFDGAGKALGILFLRFPTPEAMHHFCQHHNELIQIELQ